MNARKIIISIVAIAGLTATIAAQNSQAADIIREMESREVFDNAFVQGRMIINDRFGEKVSTFDSWAMGSEYSLIEFTSVEELGQKVLRIDDDLYIYYPDADEEIRLSGSALRDGMLGSDVSYEDMTGERSLLDDYRITDFSQEDLAGVACWVIELEALRPSVAYPRQIIWIDQESGNGVQSHKFSLSDRLLKVEQVRRFRELNGYSFPVDIVVQDMLKRNSSTEFIIEAIEIDVDYIDEDTFSRSNLTW